ncbi:MAG: YybH family protein [Magnetospiraceae bacterium]
MTVRDAVQAGDQKMVDAINDGNAAAIAPLYTLDAAILPPGTPRQDGREAIQAYWQGAIDMGLTVDSLTSHEVDQAGDLAIAIGVFNGSVPDGSGGRAPVAGKFIVIWRQDADGAWRLHRDIWNMDA